jgi:hypothetical protein
MAEEIKASVVNSNDKKFVESIPYRVQAALQFASMINCRFIFASSSDLPKEVELTQDEVSTRKKALECLGRYFDGEIDYGDRPPTKDQEKIDVQDKMKNDLKNMKSAIENILEKIEC